MSSPQLVLTGNPFERRITYSTSLDISSSSSVLDMSIEEEYEFADQVSSVESGSDVDEQETPEVSFFSTSMRVSTAPARPLTDFEEFRRSSGFFVLERVVQYSSYLVLRSDTKYDLDSEEGQRACKNFLTQLEHLVTTFKVETMQRSYRQEFSKAYRVLYKENSVCYLTEILDSAQEGFPYLWVNGEKYVFSRQVLDAGQRLFTAFCKIHNFIRDIYNRLHETGDTETVDTVVDEMVAFLEEFDGVWVCFERYYVRELMLIEADARRYITEAIEYEREMVFYEIKEKAKGKLVFDCPKYNMSRHRFVETLCKINSVANFEGKGRDDLSLDIMIKAEALVRRQSLKQTNAIRVLFTNIKKSFTDLRKLLRRYEQNIEIVDPQLKNNPDLTELLVDFETSWEKGKLYILDEQKCQMLFYASSYFNRLMGVYPVLREQIECRDAELFCSLPGLLIVRGLESDDEGICSHFYPPILDDGDQYGAMFRRLSRAYNLGKLAACSEEDYISLLEQYIIGEPVSPETRTQTINSKFDNIDYVLHKIRILAMEMCRYRPTDWNCFLDVVLAVQD